MKLSITIAIGAATAIQSKKSTRMPARSASWPVAMRFGAAPTGVAVPPIEAAYPHASISAVPNRVRLSSLGPSPERQRKRESVTSTPMAIGKTIAVAAAPPNHIAIAAVTQTKPMRILVADIPIQRRARIA